MFKRKEKTKKYVCVSVSVLFILMLNKSDIVEELKTKYRRVLFMKSMLSDCITIGDVPLKSDGKLGLFHVVSPQFE